MRSPRTMECAWKSADVLGMHSSWAAADMFRRSLSCQHFLSRPRQKMLGVGGCLQLLGVVANIRGMTKQQRADHIRQRLAGMYPETPIPLDHTNPFTLLVAVLLSAQCTDARVNTVTPALFALGDHPSAMMRVPVEAIRGIIRPCGLSPRKSQAISDLSRILVDQHGGEVPADFAALEALPGVGHKTASVVMAQAFGVPAFPVDTHIHRLATRWKLTSGRNVEQTERDLKRLFPKEEWNKLHLRIIFYGREHCTARGCDSTCCPICSELRPSRLGR
jgi:endonuclease III